MQIYFLHYLMARKPKSVETINEWLGLDGINAKLLLRGNSLYCQATIPTSSGPKQTQIPLGIKHTDAGLDDAKLAALEIHRQLALGTFDRRDWGRPAKAAIVEGEESIGELLARFEDYYRSTNKLTTQTWEDHWAYVFRRLPAKEPLRSDLLIRLVKEAKTTPRKQKEYAQKLQRLANFAKLDVDLRQYAGGYKPAARTIPSDEEIERCREYLAFNPSWQWAFGVMATFGVRPHEVFFCEFVNPLKLRVIKGKTGSRTTKAIHKRWAEEWDLANIDRPVNRSLPLTHKYAGQKVANFFYQHRGEGELTFKPYDLRHAWCIRGTVAKKIPLPVMAAYAGHTADLHLKTYNKWISDAQAEAAYDAIDWD